MLRMAWLKLLLSSVVYVGLQALKEFLNSSPHSKGMKKLILKDKREISLG